MATKTNHYIVILCGGTGPRLWPLSRATKPKQFLNLFGKNSLIKNTYDRFLKIVPKNNIYFVSNKKYLQQLKNDLGQSVPNDNFISEPSKKNTALATLLGISVIKRIDPTAIITTSPADHFIDNLIEFKKEIQLAHKLATIQNKVVTIGIKPSSPNPAYGYILPSKSEKDIFTVNKFIEKPSVIDANLYIKKNAYWNSGIYTFSIPTIINEFSTCQPDYFQLYLKLSSNLNNTNAVYKTNLSLPIDKAVSEKSTNLIMITAKFIWSDIGEWQSIWQKLTKTEEGMATISKGTQFVSVNSKNCLVNSNNKKLVGMVGLNNLAIIDTNDSLLVCNLNDSYSVRDLITKIVNTPRLKKYFLENNDK